MLPKHVAWLAHATGVWKMESDGSVLVRVSVDRVAPAPRPAPAILAHVEALRRLLDGELERYTLPARAEGTPFQVAVWEALRDIPYGETLTYGALAKRIRAPGAARAVGSACGANPLVLVVPCHRVVASNGGLGGYAYGRDVKRALLAHESQEARAPHAHAA